MPIEPFHKTLGEYNSPTQPINDWTHPALFRKAAVRLYFFPPDPDPGSSGGYEKCVYFREAIIFLDESDEGQS